jgi:hypothetical protein
MMIGMIMLLLSDTTAVDIRALVSQDIDRATMKTAAAAGKGFAERVFGISDFVMIVELAMIAAMTVLLVALVLRARKMMREQRKKIDSAQRMTVKRPPAISRTEIERILNQIATERVQMADNAAGSYYVDNDGKLDSVAAIQAMARTHGMESGRLNFAINIASQSARQSGAKFKEAFALVSESSDLNVLARQLNMGRGELELILALKRSKIANSRTVAGSGGGRK